MDIQSIIHKMTLEQKISLLCTGGQLAYHCWHYHRARVPSLTMSDGTNGVGSKSRAGLLPCNLYDTTVNFILTTGCS